MAYHVCTLALRIHDTAAVVTASSVEHHPDDSNFHFELFVGHGSSILQRHQQSLGVGRCQFNLTVLWNLHRLPFFLSGSLRIFSIILFRLFRLVDFTLSLSSLPTPCCIHRNKPHRVQESTDLPLCNCQVLATIRRLHELVHDFSLDPRCTAHHECLLVFRRSFEHQCFDLGWFESLDHFKERLCSVLGWCHAQLN